MRLALWLSVLLVSSVWAADEAADRAAIAKVISILGSAPNTPGLFTGDFTDSVTLRRLEVTHDETTTRFLEAMAQCDPHQPWGELNPCVPANLLPASRFVIQTIRLVTPSVALNARVRAPPGGSTIVTAAYAII